MASRSTAPWALGLGLGLAVVVAWTSLDDPDDADRVAETNASRSAGPMVLAPRERRRVERREAVRVHADHVEPGRSEVLAEEDDPVRAARRSDPGERWWDELDQGARYEVAVAEAIELLDDAKASPNPEERARLATSAGHALSLARGEATPEQRAELRRIEIEIEGIEDPT